MKKLIIIILFISLIIISGCKEGTIGKKIILPEPGWTPEPEALLIFAGPLDVYPYFGFIPFQTQFQIGVMQEPGTSGTILWDGYSIKVLFGDGNFSIVPLLPGQYAYYLSHTYNSEGLLYTTAQLIKNEEVIDEIQQVIFSADSSNNFSQYYPNYEINMEQGYLILNESRFFPIGGLVLPSWYGGVNEMVEAKMNFIWLYQYYQVPILISYDWANLSANNIKIIFGSYNSVAPVNPYANILPLYTQEDIILGLISDSEFGNLIGWSNRDEPGWVNISIDDVEEAYNTIKEYDPNRVIFMNFAPAHPTDDLEQYIGDARAYSQYADVISLDIYPIMDSCFENPPVCVCDASFTPWDPYCILNNSEISVVGDFVDLFKQQIIQDDNKPFWMNLQAFKAPGQQINPSYEQMRFMTYQSIIHGATGVYYYSPDDNLDIWNSLKSITQEISSLSNVLTTDYSYKAINTEDGIEYLKIPYSNTEYIIAVNRNNQVVQKSFSTDYPNKFVDVLYENRQLNINSNGMFSDTFQPFDTHIYLITLYEMI